MITYKNLFSESGCLDIYYLVQKLFSKYTLKFNKDLCRFKKNKLTKIKYDKMVENNFAIFKRPHGVYVVLF